jgi:hypothetical protein
MQLDLRGNEIGEQGGKMIYEMLKIRKSLAASKKTEPCKISIDWPFQNYN